LDSRRKLMLPLLEVPEPSYKSPDDKNLSRDIEGWDSNPSDIDYRASRVKKQPPKKIAPIKFRLPELQRARAVNHSVVVEEKNNHTASKGEINSVVGRLDTLSNAASHGVDSVLTLINRSRQAEDIKKPLLIKSPYHLLQTLA